jgi:hypothetical protein
MKYCYDPFWGYVVVFFCLFYFHYYKNFKKDDRGVYRRVPVRIMGVKHELVQPYLIEPQIEQLLDWYKIMMSIM